jgi:hypothetical protein
MKLSNFKLLIDSWEWVKEMALSSIHKSYSGGEITSEWKLNILLTRHSPIRELRIKYKLIELKRWIADQLVRHSIGVNNSMGTGRPDRNNIPRDKQTMEFETELYQSHNAESFINMMENRLCVGCVSKETRLICESLRDEVEKTEPELAFMCVPNCIKLSGCKEMFVGHCSYFTRFMDYVITEYGSWHAFDIKKRYTIYHEWRKK